VNAKFAPFAESTKKPRLHPMVQIVTTEWKAAAHEQRQPRWFIFTDSYLKRVCEQVVQANPKWHKDLSKADLSPYTAGMPPKSQWWLVDAPAGDGVSPYF
jgi:hypothetical protein